MATSSKKKKPEAPEFALVIESAGWALSRPGATEIAGRVVDAGDAVKDWIGREVIVPAELACGECDACRRGHVVACSERDEAPRSSDDRRQHVQARYVVSLDEALRPATEPLWRLAALCRAALLPYAALVGIGVGPTDRLIVVGAGPLGLFATMLGRALGAHVVVLDANADRRALATGVGANETHSDEDGPDAIGAVLAHASQKIVATSATGAARYFAITMAAPGAMVALLDDATASDPIHVPRIDWDRFCAEERHAVGFSAAHPDLLPELVAITKRHGLPLDRVCRRFAPDERAAAIAARRAGTILELPVIVFDPA